MNKITEFIKTHKAVAISVGVTLAVMVVALVTLLMFLGNDSDSSESKPVSTPSESQPSESTPPSSSAESSSQAENSSDAESAEPEPEIELAFTAPSKKDITVYSPVYIIKGKGDPQHPLTINSVEVAMDESGYFAQEVTLALGDNTFSYSHKEKSGQFVIRYRMIIIKEAYPAAAVTVESVSDLVVSCLALQGSSVSATWCGQTIGLYQADSGDGNNQSEYVTYIGVFKTPHNTGTTKNYGKVSFSAVSNYGSGTKNSGNINVKTFDVSRYDGGNGYPADSSYLNVGMTYVAEIICDQAETFNSDDATDLSRPTNNYLPKGTVDYCSPYTRTFKAGGENLELYTLRYGKQVYVQTKNSGTNISVYESVLPEHNNVEFTSLDASSRHTVMTFKVDWKAPFKFELGPQTYTNISANRRDYTISEATFDHIDITFCYSQSIIELPDLTDNPLFSSAEMFVSQYDCTLRLHLKERGKFYGWTAEYNEAGELEFRFLNPATLTVAENEFGYSLEGLTVVVDAGHGGYDPGALGYAEPLHEAQLNLFLAQELKAQLEALGARVVLTRSEDIYVSAQDRVSTLRNARPDFAISIHRNANNSTRPSGFESFHFNPYTSAAAHSIYNATLADGLYEKTANSRVKWHVFFLSRVSDCPVVLTENGYVTNRAEYNNMTNPEFNKKCATAMIKGMINYFNS